MLAKGGGGRWLRVAWLSALLAAVPAMARAQVVSSEIDTGKPVTGTVPATVWEPALAFDGINFLAVWSDNRSPYDENVYAARVTPGGQLLDPLGIVVSGAPNTQTSPQVAFDGTQFVVVWLNERNDTTGVGVYDVYAARVTSGGQVLDPSGILLASGGVYEQPWLAAGGGSSLVAWADIGGTDGGAGVYATRLGAGGTVLDPSPITLASLAGKAGSGTSIATAFDGTRSMVAWIDPGDGGSPQALVARRVAADGGLVDPAPLPIAAASYLYAPAVAFDGNAYLAAWSGAGDSGVLATRTSVDLVPLDTPPLTLVAPSGSFGVRSLVASAGGNYLAAWTDPSFHTFALTVGADGGVGTATRTAPLATREQVGAVVGGGGEYLVAWTDTALRASRVTGDGQLLDQAGFPLALSANAEQRAAVAASRTQYLVAWRDSRTPALWATRVAADGTVLDPAGIPLGGAAESPADYAVAPVVVSDREGFLVAWIERGSDQVLGVRVAADGSLLDPQPVVYAAGVGADAGPSFGPWLDALAATFDGSSYVLAWEATYMDGCVVQTAWTSGSSGAPAPVQWPNCPYGQLNLASDGASTLLAWKDPSRGGLVGVRYAAGKLVDAAPKVLAPVGGLSAPVGLVAGASGYLTVWADGQTSSDIALYAARISSDAQPLDPTPLAVAKGSVDLASWGLAFDGTSYLVAWSQSLAGQPAGVRATTIGTDGSVAAPFDLAPSPAGGQQPALASLGPGGSLVAYQRFDLLEPYRSIRVRMRTITDVPGPSDGGAADSGLADAGVSGGPAIDAADEAGAHDAGPGAVDAGVGAHDASVHGTGVAPDAGEGPVSQSGGCGCIASGGSPAGGLAAALALVAAALRRRKR